MNLRIAVVGLFALMLGCSGSQSPSALRPGAGDSRDNPPPAAASDSRSDANLAAEAASIEGAPDELAAARVTGA
jgi:hypothetical protein